MVRSLEFAKQQGFDCKSFYGRSKNDENDSVFFGENRIINKLIDFRVALEGNPGHLHTVATKKLIKYLDAFKPDIVHFQNIHGNYIDFPLLFRYLISHKIKVVATLHDCWTFTGHCAHYPESCSRWQTGCGDCPDIHRYMRSLFFDHTQFLLKEKKDLFLESKTVFIAPSKWILGQFKQSELSSCPVFLIPNGIETSVFNLAPQRLGDKIRILGVAHPWSNEKGLDVFNRLARSLDPDLFEIVLVGVDSTLCGEVASSIKTFGLIRSKKELADLYASSDLFINPTQFDTFPTVNLEAMASGIPLFVFDVGGAAEVVTSKTGLVFKKGDVEGLLAAIQSYKRNTYSREQIIAESQKYSEQVQFQSYVDLYRSLLSAK